ncbi:hypothetical protein MMPV_005062 [Pyropia vietnamensis]
MVTSAFLPAPAAAAASVGAARPHLCARRPREASAASAATRRADALTMKQASSNGPVSRTASPGDSNGAVPSSAVEPPLAPRANTLGHVIVVGLSHHTASVDVRERLAIPEAEWQSAAQELVDRCDSISEAAVLSTCNRFEIYAVANHPQAGVHELLASLSERSGVAPSGLRRHMFMLTETEAVWHLLRVSAGLDSLVIGEGQILSQVKRCFELATAKEGMAGKILGRCLNTAVSAGKRVRSETGIAKGAVSISSAAVELAEMRAPTDSGKPIASCAVVIIGAGKMARLLVQHLLSRGVENITVVNRSMERAGELAKMFGDADIKLRMLDEMVDAVVGTDLVFTSTGSADPIINARSLGPRLEGAIASGTRAVDSQLMLIDISVPRNVAADVGDLPGAAVYNVDDLKAVVAKNQARRRRLSLEAEDLLHEELTAFNNWHHSLGCVPAITKLQKHAEAIRSEEWERVQGKLVGLSKSERKAVEQLSKGIVAKLLHGPMVHLRSVEDMKERVQTLKNLENLFRL